ncbi:hypothetical protein CP532_2144 [Ophiocordyceps camponoti-leonardi (nom. inval.)]|nr:hypothetical protein CP532_2144 [Ophiocordyceps camponoti-leonardi (nom. inval.)]
MFLQRVTRSLRRPLHLSRLAGPRLLWTTKPALSASMRWFTDSRWRCAIKPVLLADIGEGIVECEVIQWFVEPGAHIDEFSPLCEVQSDKASVEITSRFAGTVKKLYYEPGEMAKVGKPFVDIDIAGEVAPSPSPAESAPTSAPTPAPAPTPTPTAQTRQGAEAEAEAKPKGKMAALATPAVRHLSRELDVDIGHIHGSGKDGRVLKEDIYRFVKQRQEPDRVPPGKQDHPASAPASAPAWTPPTDAAASSSSEPQTESRMPLTQTQQQMFKTMTRSLSIPHFLYADEIDLTDLVGLRARLNRVLDASSSSSSSFPSTTTDEPRIKLSYLPFIIKAVSLALYQYPLLNARVETSLEKPTLVTRSRHDIGVAMDTPQGLVVPVVRHVGGRTIVAIAAELARLQRLALAGKLSPSDMAGGTMTVSNVGNIGGTYLSPVVVEREVAILGIGRLRAVPAFDDQDRVVKRHVCNFSWCADHRVVDGATLARAAGVVRRVVEEPDVMLMHLR